MSKILIVVENGRLREVFSDEEMDVDIFDIAKEEAASPNPKSLINNSVIKKFAELVKGLKRIV